MVWWTVGSTWASGWVGDEAVGAPESAAQRACTASGHPPFRPSCRPPFRGPLSTGSALKRVVYGRRLVEKVLKRSGSMHLANPDPPGV